MFKIKLINKYKIYFSIIIGLLFLIFLILSLTSVYGLPNYLPDKPHPRIWLTDDILSKLRQKAANNTSDWQLLKSQADQLISMGHPIEYVHNSIMSCLLIYVTLKTSDPATANYYADEALKAMEVMHNAGLSWVQGDAGYYMRRTWVMAVGYDWLYDYPGFTQNLKNTYITDMNEWVDWYTNYGYQRDVVYSNYFQGYHTSMGLIAIATFGDNPKAENYLNMAREFFDKLKDAYTNKQGRNGYDGAWNYISQTMERIFMYMLAIKTATGEDLFSEFPWLKTQMIFKYHRMAPDWESGFDEGPWSAGNSGFNTYSDAAWAVFCFSGTLEGKYMNYFINHAKNLYENEIGWRNFLTTDPSQEEIDYTKNAPTEWYSVGRGTVFMRSDWSENATWAAFHCGPKYYDKTTCSYDKDAGHFEIFKYDWLLIDSGIYQRDGGNRFKFDTGYHNTFTFDNIESYYGNHPEMAPGQYVYLPDDEGKTDIFRYKTSNNFVYAQGKFASKYRGAVNTLTREFTFIKPDYFVILDRVETIDSSMTKHLHFNFVTEPVILNNSITNINGKGKLFIKILSPEANISKETIMDGLWRVNITPTQQKTNDIFLSVFYATESTTNSIPETLKIEASSGNMVGTFIKDPITPRVVMFSKTTSSVEEVTYTLDYPSNQTAKHLIVDLVPNKLYYIYKNGTKIAQKTSSAQGTLYFESTGGSTFTITQQEFQPTQLTGDLNQDNKVNSSDFQILIQKFKETQNIETEDLNSDGIVNIKDIGILMHYWSE